MPQIQVLIDNPSSWFMKFYPRLVEKFSMANLNDINLIHKAEQISCGDLLFILSCDRILDKGYLARNKSNLVIHASDLPKGRGWAPWTWQIINGAVDIPLSLIEASEKVDAGPVYYKSSVKLNGHELIDEIREKLAYEIINMSVEYAKKWPDIVSTPQIGKPSYFPRRTKLDQKISMDQTISQIFNQIRVADNQKYPLYFEHQEFEYVIHVYKRKKEN